MRKQEQKGKITALYERLSHDDGRSAVTCSPWAIVVLSSTILTFFRFILPQLCQRVHFFFEKSCVWRIHERDMEVQ